MKFEKMIHVIDSHTCGENTRMVYGGLPDIPGKTMLEKLEYYNKNLDFGFGEEPRVPHGYVKTAIITAPTSEKADFGMLFPPRPHMCGHGTIGVVTSLIECGYVDPVEPVTEVNLDTPVGLVTSYANIKNGSVESVTIQNVPSFLFKTISIKLPKLSNSNIKVDIAYGGLWSAIISGDDVGVKISPENLPNIVDVAFMVKNAVSAELERQGIKPKHPEISVEIGECAQTSVSCRIYGNPENPKAHSKNFTGSFRDENKYSIFYDRSPCGTGTSAQMAALFSHGALRLNEEFIVESIIGTIFKGKLISTAKVGEYNAVIPEITGSAYINSLGYQVVSPNDPFKKGLPFELPLR